MISLGETFTLGLIFQELFRSVELILNFISTEMEKSQQSIIRNYQLEIQNKRRVF